MKRWGCDPAMNTVLLFGRIHPLVLHFPIALLLLAATVELARLKWDRPDLARLVPFLLALGAVGAFAASASGWVFATEYHPAPSERWMLDWHRRLGLATTVVALVAAWFAMTLADATSPQARCFRRIAVVTAAALVSITAHFGALMVWGADYFDLAGK